MEVPYYKFPRSLLNDVIVYLRRGTWDEVNQMMLVIQTGIEGPFEDGENGVPKNLSAPGTMATGSKTAAGQSKKNAPEPVAASSD